MSAYSYDDLEAVVNALAARETCTDFNDLRQKNAKRVLEALIERGWGSIEKQRKEHARLAAAALELIALLEEAGYGQQEGPALPAEIDALHDLAKKAR